MLKIGDKIKQLRKEQDVTQEKLAAYLNISYQAVSKWENNTALPDITLIPQLANFFGVSTDELLGMKETVKTEELAEYEKMYRENNRLGKLLDNIALCREVLTKYPRNYHWMLNLSYPLMQYNDTDEHLQYSKEHSFVEEAIHLCERILEDCTTDSIRHGAIQVLCYCYAGTNQEKRACELANEMPSMYVSKDHLLSHIFKGEKRIEQNQRLLLAMIDDCANIIGLLASNAGMGKEISVPERIELVETANQLYAIILKDDSDSLFYNCRLSHNYRTLARLWCENGDTTKAIENLLLAEKTATDYDTCTALGEQKYKSLLANRCTFNPKDAGKNFEGTETELLFHLLNQEFFDSIRTNDAFIQLYNRVKRSIENT